MGMAGAVFEPQPPDFGKIHVFEDFQMIVNLFLAKSNSIEFWCTFAKLGIHV